jgi:hypothetical protein
VELRPHTHRRHSVCRHRNNAVNAVSITTATGTVTLCTSPPAAVVQTSMNTTCGPRALIFGTGGSENGRQRWRLLWLI